MRGEHIFAKEGRFSNRPRFLAAVGKPPFLGTGAWHKRLYA
jgi:hypothetical protein